MRAGLVIILLIFMESLTAQPVVQSMRRLPDSGQQNSYTATFGEDSDFPINIPAFDIPGDGTVTDTVTGLQWQQTDGGEMTVENARIYCDTLTLAGFTDWRLPTAHEAFSIMNHDRTNPALDQTVFTVTGAEYWWTSDRQVNDSTKIWVTNSGGGIGNHRKSETISAGGTKRFHARAVRNVQSPVTLPARFISNPDGTVTDALTALIWKPTPFSDSLTWENALQYADTCHYAGISDWRLPNSKEIQSINDESRISPSINTSYFTALSATKYWSSTSLPNLTSRAWFLDTQFGIMTYDEKTVRHDVLLVTGGNLPITAWQENAFDETWQAYPNPFFNRLNISGPGKAENEALLLDITGKIVYRSSIAEGIAGDNLQPGLYILYLPEEGLRTRVIRLSMDE